MAINAVPKLEKRRDKNTGMVISKNVPILIDVTFDSKRLWLQTGERIDENKWDVKNNRVKPSVTGSVEINNLIKTKCEEILKIYREAKLMGKEVTVAYIRNGTKVSIPTTNKNIWQLYDEFIEGYKIKHSPNTVKVLNTNKKHFLNFSKKIKLNFDFNIIDNSLLNKYVEYLQKDLNHTNNTIAKVIKVLKRFLNWATQSGYNKNLAYNLYKTQSFLPEIIILNGEELSDLYNFEFNNTTYNQVRDVFVFCSMTCMRYSDVKALKKTDINDGYIKITSIKTKTSTEIPLIDDAKVILNRNINPYSTYALPVISNQKMNDYLKVVCKIAGLNRMVTKVTYRGYEKIETTQPLHEVVTTHFGRKTCISFLFYMGLDSELIRAISNHKSISSFARYNKIAIEHKSREMKKAFEDFGKIKFEKLA
ncbi:site-specific integrase [Pedobacter hartonius]|uniref:Site-specific recombinase XerD n=1 Tax=Pedobacter hartonius TaxID=425514 RepID=A0A1H4F662_9SPHI|nr:site-specific integrase [Pedobacter hartonius]SEA92397.1 Site-specific recombinase XerD [Pedobacter hartonius]